MSFLTPAIQAIIFGVVTKSVGSIFRVKDDWEAPRQVLRNTVMREGLLLGLTTAFTTASQALFSKTISPVLARTPRLQPYELLFRAIAATGGIFLAEITSRAVAPKTPWDERLESGNRLNVISRDEDGDDDSPFSGLPARANFHQYPLYNNAQPLRNPLTFSRTFARPGIAGAEAAQPVKNHYGPATFRGTFRI
jgi:hypothetical protein